MKTIRGGSWRGKGAQGRQKKLATGIGTYSIRTGQPHSVVTPSCPAEVGPPSRAAIKFP